MKPSFFEQVRSFLIKVWLPKKTKHAIRGHKKQQMKSPLLRALFRTIASAQKPKKQVDQAQKGISRRDFLEKSSMAAGGFLLGNAGIANLLVDKKLPVDAQVVIVGAGLAGLTAAWHLQKAGIKATIYEADKNVGGRIKTLRGKFGSNRNTELGGEFIDSNHEDMFALCREFGLKIYDVLSDKPEFAKDTYFFEGQHYTELQVITEFKKIAKKLKKDQKSLGPDYDTVAFKALDLISLEDYINGLTCSNWFKQLLKYAYVSEFGLEPQEQSCLNMIDMIDPKTKSGFKIYGDSDEKYKILGGNASLIEALRDKLKDQIVTNKALTYLSKRGNMADMRFGDTSVVADIVILTLPFTRLRQVEMTLEGATPTKLRCIQELGYGNNNKVIIGFNDRPWRLSQKPATGMLFSDLMAGGWDSNHMQALNEGGAGYTCFLGGDRSKMIGSEVTERNAPQIGDNIAQEFVSMLDSVYPGAQSSYNNSFASALWSEHPHTQGSYTCFKPGQWTLFGGNLAFEPVGPVYFAGEHCSEEFQGYMNGSAETGRRAAEAVLLGLATLKQ
jgi:monoamine oxidase